MTKSVISVDKMVRIYVDSELDISVWNMFRDMCIHDLISNTTWERFYSECINWVFSDDQTEIIDITNENGKSFTKGTMTGIL